MKGGEENKRGESVGSGKEWDYKEVEEMETREGEG